MRTPNLFIIGAQKSGTTYLANVLARHPDVFFCSPKEPLFFSKPEIDQSRYERYLETNFADAREEKWVGEGSTTYLQWPRALKNLKSFIPGTPKIIVCMRQPTEKAVSFYIHNWRRGRYARDIRIGDTAAMPVSLSSTKTSCYASSLTRWLDAYPREAFCFLKFDQLRDDPAGFVRKATAFLEIPERETVLRKTVNAGFSLTWRGDSLVIDDPDAPPEGRPEFTRTELEDIHALMQEDIAETERLTGLDLDEWRKFPAFAATDRQSAETATFPMNR